MAICPELAFKDIVLEVHSLQLLLTPVCCLLIMWQVCEIMTHFKSSLRCCLHADGLKLLQSLFNHHFIGLPGQTA